MSQLLSSQRSYICVTFSVDPTTVIVSYCQTAPRFVFLLSTVKCCRMVSTSAFMLSNHLKCCQLPSNAVNCSQLLSTYLGQLLATLVSASRPNNPIYFVFLCQLLSSVDSHCFVNLSRVLNNFPHLPFDVNCCQMSSQFLSTYLSQLKATGVHFPATTRPLPCFWQKARHSVGERHISFVYQDSSLFFMEWILSTKLLYCII